MTIASAFNDIAVAQGGTAAKSGAITAAIDALNDALAGSDQPQAKTIEQAVRLLGEHIGGGGGGDIPAGYYVISRDSYHRLDKTWSEINTMYDNGAGWIFIASPDSNPQFVSNVVHEDGTYGVLATDITDNTILVPYATDSADGYPMPMQG